MFFFILQLDAYLYLLDIISIAPFAQVLFVITSLLIAYLSYNYKSGYFFSQLSHESLVLLFCLLIYIGVQVFGILTWDLAPTDIMLLIFWVYMIVLLFLGALSGILIGNRIHYLLYSLLIILTTVTVIDSLFGGISISEQWGRSASTLRNPNSAAFVITLLMLGSFRWQRLGFIEIFAIAIAGVGIVLTQSRGGMLAYLIAVLYFSIWWSNLGQTSDIRAKRRLIAGLLSTALLCITTTVLFASRYGSDGIDNVLSAALSDPNARDHAIKISLELINEKPLFGHGTGFVYTQQLGPHNMLLRAWVENGIPGLLGIMILPLGLLWIGIVRKDHSIIALTIVLCIIGMTTHNLTESRSILIVVGMLLANSAVKKSPSILKVNEVS